LYDTQEKKYISLDTIAEFIRKGIEVQVVDHTTGEDLTALTLSQIIFEQEKKQGSFLPHALLTNLIQAGEDRLSTIQRSLGSPRNLLHQIDEEIKRRVQSLINQGDLTEGEGRNLIELLIRKAPRSIEEAIFGDYDLEQALANRQIPTREDLQQLSQQLEELAQKLEEIEQDQNS